MTAGTLPGAATHTKWAHPACSAALITHGAGLIFVPGLQDYPTPQQQSHDSQGCAGMRLVAIVRDAASIEPRVDQGLRPQ